MKFSADRKSQPARATFLIVHGLSEYGARYAEMAAYLRTHGFESESWDLPGHGERRGERPAEYEWFATFLRETEARIDALRARQQDVLLFGHSMGGTIVLKRLQQRGLDKLLGAAVAAPFLAPFGLAQQTLFKGIRLLAKGFPQAAIPGKNLARNLTSDSQKQEEYRRDPRILNRIPLDLFTELHRSGSELINRPFPHLSPLYFAYGKKDPVCSPEVFHCFLKANPIQEDQIHSWPKARHELANERIREDFFQTLCEWGRATALSRG